MKVVWQSSLAARGDHVCRAVQCYLYTQFRADTIIGYLYKSEHFYNQSSCMHTVGYIVTFVVYVLV